MNDKIDRLSELQIDRGPESAGRSRWPSVVLGILGLAVLSSIGFWVFGSKPVPVTVTTIRLTQSGGDAASVLDASGYVVARRQATVSSKIAGKVLEVLVEEGVMVQRDGHA